MEVGKRLERSVSVLLSAMDQPLGIGIGHTLEVAEAIDMLKGQGPDDLKEVVLTLGAMQLVCAKKAETLEAGKALLQSHLDDGTALAKFKAIIEAQHGDSRVLEDYNLMPQAEYTWDFVAERDGFVQELVALNIGEATRNLGGGRWKKEDVLDLGVGIKLHKKRGDQVSQGDVLATLYYNDKEKLAAAQAEVESAYTLSDTAPAATALIGDIIWAK